MIAAGHQWQDIQNYSYGQIKIFLKSASQLERERQATAIRNLRLAAWGEGKEVKRVVEYLDNS